MSTTRVIITGGPGAGKTTLLAELATLGYATVGESARAVIAERVAAGETPRPQPPAFAREILRRDVDKYLQQPPGWAWVFFDRGVVDALGMLQEVAPLPPDQLASMLCAYPFHRTVFILRRGKTSTDRTPNETRHSTRPFPFTPDWCSGTGHVDTSCTRSHASLLRSGPVMYCTHSPARCQTSFRRAPCPGETYRINGVMRRPRYQAVVIDDNDGLRKLLVECLLFSDVEVEGFAEAEEFLRRLSPLNQSPTVVVPDLVIVDLELKPKKMQGLELIADLVKRDIASEIVAITGHHSSSTLVENAMCFGAAAIFTKPFGDIWAFVQRLEQIARIGQNRRLSRSAALEHEWYDRSRRRRARLLHGRARPDLWPRARDNDWRSSAGDAGAPRVARGIRALHRSAIELVPAVGDAVRRQRHRPSTQ